MAMRMKINRDVLDKDLIMSLAEDEMFGLGNGGICLACGEEADGCEPDARGYLCEVCGEHSVVGAAEACLMGLAG